jgi:hypothetical protein
MLNVTYPIVVAVDLEARDAATAATDKAQSALDAVASLGALSRRDTILVSHIADPENLAGGGAGLDQDFGLIVQPVSSTVDLGSIL